MILHCDTENKLQKKVGFLFYLQDHRYRHLLKMAEQDRMLGHQLLAMRILRKLK